MVTVAQPEQGQKRRKRQTTVTQDFQFDLREDALPTELRPVAQRLYLQIRRLAPSDALVWDKYALEYIVPEHPEDAEYLTGRQGYECVMPSNPVDEPFWDVVPLNEGLPGPGYPYYLLYHHISYTTSDWRRIVQIRANDLNPQEISRQLMPVQRKLAIFLTYLGFDPDRTQHIDFGAITDPTEKVLRVKHLF
jgi:hypothetical protein